LTLPRWEKEWQFGSAARRKLVVEAGRLVLFWAAIPHQTIAVAETEPNVCLYLPLIDFLGLPVDRKARQAIMQGRFLAQANPDTMAALTLPRW
ncbi:hypothetical protein ACCS53_37765, partial [Rhizobium ruizarguesonis]